MMGEGTWGGFGMQVGKMEEGFGMQVEKRKKVLACKWRRERMDVGLFWFWLDGVRL